ncbi:MAG: glycoside hydrolase family 3 N-terminal domain-containing protein [bacterium]
MLDYKKAPFNLGDEEIKWVEDTFKELNDFQKVNQVIIDMAWSPEEKDLKNDVAKHNFGGYRYHNTSAESLFNQNSIIQKGKIPALIAANVEGGGDGGVKGGTKIGDPVALAATGNPENAYYMAYYGCKEAAAVGCNWTFSPIVDIDINWRNCIISNRSFGQDTDTVLEFSKEYLRGAKDAGVECCMKHFPGDGCDDRDQHLCVTINDLSTKDWDKTFGKVYKGMIDAGVSSIMVGHMVLPSYQKKFRPELKDEDLMPATLAPELLQDLLRDQLGFNGLVITDATHMLGLTATIPRREFMPGVIMAGCDMVLFMRDTDEDIKYMMDALEDGRLTRERLDEAVKNVLAYKAMMKLPKKQKDNTIMPSADARSIIGCIEHKEKAKQILDESITLVKNTRKQLPLDPIKHKNVIVYSATTASAVAKLAGNAPVEKKLVDALNARGFNAELYKLNPLKLVTRKGLNGKKLLSGTPIEEFNKKYDACFLICDVTGYSESNGRSIKWKIPMGPEIPWYVTELPTVVISTAWPFHLHDLPMVPTYINTYNSSELAIEMTVDKIIGKSEFKGVSPVDAFCGSWDTKK